MGFGFGTDIASSLLAGKPSIPNWGTVDLGQQQTKAINENTASLPALEGEASNVNSFNSQQLMSTLGQAIPGFEGLSEGISNNIDSMLKGELPADVQSNIQDSAAARSLTGGFGGSGLAGNLTARDLGLNSLDLTQQGISSAQKWIGQMAQITTPQLFNVQSMFVTPQQQFEDTFQNQTAQFQDQYAQDQNNWQHSLGVAAGQDIQDTASTTMSLVSSFLGGGGGMKIPKMQQQQQQQQTGDDTDSDNSDDGSGFSGGGGAFGD